MWAAPARASHRFVLTDAIATISVVAFLVVATSFPNLKLIQIFSLAEDSTPIVESGKIKAVENIVTMYGDIPHTALVGSGPATLSSRAYLLFSKPPRQEKEAAGAILVGMREGELYGTDVADKYISSIPFVPVQGGTTISSPRSSYISLAGETGLAGLVICLVPYGMALVFSFRTLHSRSLQRDPLTFRLAFASFGGILLILVQSLFDNWL